jgi:hypothetical protein
VPKTGSSSVFAHILNNMEWGASDIHTPFHEQDLPGKNFFHTEEHYKLSDFQQFGYLTPKNIKEYKIYAVVRNPVDKFISTLYYDNGRHLNQDVSSKSVDELFEMYYERVKTTHINKHTVFYMPQTTWLTYKGKPINGIFPYEKLQKMCDDIIKKHVPIKYSYKSGLKSNDLSISQKNLEYIKEKYKEDFKIYNLFYPDKT